MTRRQRWSLRFTGILALVALTSCEVLTLRRQLLTPEQLGQVPRNSPYLKAHMKSGDVIVLSEWKFDSVARSISGTGTRLDRNRTAGPATTHQVHLDSVALFESNVIHKHGSVAALTVVTIGSAILTVACLSDPKACFGSCPTFYAADSSGRGTRLQAEGFSASVAPALEATDVDALYRVRPRGSRFDVRMTNEAQETHVVRWVKLLAAERPPVEGGRVFATQRGEFWQAPSVVSPSRCAAAEGDCLAAVRALDDVERFSVADSTDLAAREVIELEFPPLAGDTLGLVIGSRQTLLSTFVLYQTLAYMGRNASAFLAALGGGGDRVRERATGPGRVLGGIEVQAQDAQGKWKLLGETQETGPLATDVRVVVLKNLPHGARHIRLRLTKGHWRIDYLSLAPLTQRVRPIVMDPARVMRGQVEDAAALEQLRDSSRTLVTFPGDEYTLQYALPDGPEKYELFLESRGYYLEWMRKEWLAEENLPRAAAMFRDPARALRELAPAFKKQEAKMEEAFWNSRYVRH